jgi:hypothetical protein
MTVKELIEKLKGYPQDAEVKLVDNSDVNYAVDFIDTVVLCEDAPIGTCVKCGSACFEEKDGKLSKDYKGFCPTCDENLYSFEINKY